MRITIAGTPGSGKSTVAKEVASKLGLKHYSVGDFMRFIAKKRNVSLLELNKLAENDGGWIDQELDDMQVRIGKTDNFVIDSRLGFHFIPDSIKVFLRCSDSVAAKRVYTHLRDEERENTTLSQTLSNVKRRKLSEKKRYETYYHLNITKTDMFDLIIDTTELKPEQVAKEIIEKFIYFKIKT